MDRKFKPPFFWRRYSAELPSVSSAQELGENRGFASAGSGGAAARKCSIGAPSRRALELRASGAVGLRWQAVSALSGRLEKIEPLRRGARRGAGRQAEMGEDFDNHRRIFDSGDDLQGTAAVRALFDVDVEDPFEKPGPTHARRRTRRTLRVRVI